MLRALRLLTLLALSTYARSDAARSAAKRAVLRRERKCAEVRALTYERSGEVAK